MSITSQNIILTPSFHRFDWKWFSSYHIKSPSSSLLVSGCFAGNLRRLLIKKGRLKSTMNSFRSDERKTRALGSGDIVDGITRTESISFNNIDGLLSVAEVLCIVPSVVFSIGFLANSAISSSKNFFVISLSSRFFMFQFGMLICTVFIGFLIRRRQWRRIYENSLDSGTVSYNLIRRIEKLEEDLRSSVTIIRVLSRQIEKLGIRFRVTRKSLKDPITETASLAQKNSEATRALAMQEDILEKEIGEIQKVLLAMQEQQQKQFELILAIGKLEGLKDRKESTETHVNDNGNIEGHFNNNGTIAHEKRDTKQVTAINFNDRI